MGGTKRAIARRARSGLRSARVRTSSRPPGALPVGLSIDIITTDVTRDELTTIDSANIRGLRLILQDTLREKIQNQVQKAQPIVIEKISVSQNIQYPREVLEALENEKKVLLGQRAKVAEENIKNLINQKRVESEIINRTNLAQTDRSILEQFNELFANDPKRAARYILLMRYAHEAGRAVDGGQKSYSPHEIIALVDQLNHQLDDGPKPVNKTHPN